jgi:hypothetical protein
LTRNVDAPLCALIASTTAIVEPSSVRSSGSSVAPSGERRHPVLTAYAGENLIATRQDPTHGGFADARGRAGDQCGFVHLH